MVNPRYGADEVAPINHVNCVTKVFESYHAMSSLVSWCVELFVVYPAASVGFDVVDIVVYLYLDVINDCGISVRNSCDVS